jgi:uncharacterized protein (DUF952 family)
VEILHLARVEDWSAALTSGEYRSSTLGMSLEEVGFIHSCTRDQLSGVAQRFYADVTDPLLVLVMDDEAIRESGTAVVFEDAGNGELFPHVYGPIRPSMVTAAIPAHIDASGHLDY